VPPAAFVQTAAVPRLATPPQPNVPDVLLVTNTDHEYAAAGCVSGVIRSFPPDVLVQFSTTWLDAGAGLVTPLMSWKVTVADTTPGPQVTVSDDGVPLAEAGPLPNASGMATSASPVAKRARTER
jgi:hypothetical protein